MITSDDEYVEFLKRKYSSKRELYLNYLIYPRYLSEFSDGPIYDIGCGFGSFLEYCRERKRQAIGIDSNPGLVDMCIRRGNQARLADILTMEEEVPAVPNLICDNVVEHLTLPEIDRFFSSIKNIWSPGGVLLLIVPNRKGFDSDPTHKTYVDDELIAHMVQKHVLKLVGVFYHPIPWRFPGDRYIFNMTVFRIENRSDLDMPTVPDNTPEGSRGEMVPADIT